MNSQHRPKPFTNTEDVAMSNVDGGNSTIIEEQLADVFDRYSSALDAGDHDAAEAVLAEYPAIADQYRAPFQGLYLLSNAARKTEFDAPRDEPVHQGRLGDFEIEFELGRGGMGIVYSATQISLRRRVALKVLPFAAVLDPRQVTRFRNEAQAAASLHHANIVPVYGVGCERGVHYYSMQLIEGQSLEQFVDEFRKNTKNDDGTARGPTAAGAPSTIVSIQSRNYVRNIIEIGAQAATAIDFAHQQGIVHRDIKPSNLLLDQTGKIWVTDFGLARCRGISNLTSHADRIGTARYMSPEQAAGRVNLIDSRTDIYSLGVTLYEILSLRPAFDGADREQVLDAIDSKEPAPLRTLNPSVPIDLETVICKAISKSPSDRYTSAGEFADDLRRCLAGTPVVAKRRTVLDRIGKSVVKHKWPITGFGLAFLIIAVTASTLAFVFFQQRQREQVAAERARFFLQQSHDAVDRFGGTLSDELQGIPGADSLRAKLLGEAIGYYTDFLKYAGDSPELTFQRAKACSELGGLYERAGDDTQTQTYLTSAIKQLTELSAHKRANEDAEYELAACMNRLGLLHKRKGEFQSAEQNFENAIERFSELSKSGVRVEILAALAQTRANLGLLKWTQGDLNSAVSHFERALAVFQQADADQMENVELRSAYYKVNGNYVAVLSEIDLDRAETELQRSIRELERVNRELQPSPLDASLTTSATSEKARVNDQQLQLQENSAHVADMQNNLAVVLSQKGEHQQAKLLVNRAIDFWKVRLVREGESPVAMERLATSLNTLGEIGWRSKEGNFGDDSFAEAESLLKRVLAVQLHRPDPLNRMAGVLHNRSLVARRNENFDEAKRLIDLAIQFQTQAINLSPDNSGYQVFLKSHQQIREAYLASARKANGD